MYSKNKPLFALCAVGAICAAMAAHSYEVRAATLVGQLKPGAVLIGKKPVPGVFADTVKEIADMTRRLLQPSDLTGREVQPAAVRRAFEAQAASSAQAQ